MNDADLQGMLRAMAWERAKGELLSMTHTYYGEPKYEEFREALNELIAVVEDSELQL